MKALDVLDPQVPSWGSARLERACPVCNEAGTSAFERPDGLCVRRCHGCACFFVAPAPSEAALVRFYEEYSSHAIWGPPAVRARTSKRVRPRADPRLMTLVRLVGGVEGKRVLDIGFGAAEDLLKLRDLGATVRGVDLDPLSVDFASQQLGLETRRGRAQAFGDDGHDLVLLHDVIEHELDVVTALEEAVSVVRKGGLLSIWTPNADVADRDPQTIIFRVDLEHMTYLSPQTIRQLAPTLGTEIVHLEAVGHPAVQDLKGGDGHKRRALRLGMAMAPGPLICGLRQRSYASGRYNIFAVLRRRA